MRMEMVRAKELIYEYEKRDEEGNVIGMSRAIDGVDLDVLPGQFVAILGHNGSRKSTLAKQINAILIAKRRYDDGWTEETQRDPDELWNVRQSAGMVFQNPDTRSSGLSWEEDVGVRYGKFGRADRRNLDTRWESLKGSRDDRIPLPFPK